MNTFIQHGHIKLIKSDIYNVTKDFKLTFYSSNNPKKYSITVYTKKSSSKTAFNIENIKKCFLSSKSAY